MTTSDIMREISQRMMTIVNMPECVLDATKSSSIKKRRPIQPVPDQAKDSSYWERRKRNNESARRSRESRRVREMATSGRVNLLEHENVKLKAELDTLREEISHLRAILYGTTRRECFSCSKREEAES